LILSAEPQATVKTPWLKNTGGVPAHLDYPDCTLYGALERCAKQYPGYTAYIFMGRKTSYRLLLQEVHLCARSLKSMGIRAGDRVTIAMPNCPQTVIMLYALNLVGAVANMVHPLSSEKEIEFFLKESHSISAITLDQFYHKFEAVRQNVELDNIIIASIKDALSQPIRTGYMLTEGRRLQRIPKDAPILRWNEFLRRGASYHWKYQAAVKAEDPAVILYSGGTTGVTKGILLSNRNFNALGMQVLATNPFFRPGDKMLSVMPMFHGFGLGVCIHTMLMAGGCCVLVPRFTPDSYAKLMLKYRCNLIAGVPTLYEALLRLPKMKKADLSCLKGVYSGGDSLSIELKKRMDKFLYDHQGTVQVREGYGLTECVTASCLTPSHMAKEGSIGIPFPDTYYKIVRHGTQEEVPYGEDGEICLSGPTVMLGYLDHPEETAQTLRRHADGLVWLHTGDLGSMDSDGFIYFKQRIKRMIVTSGYNVYPSQLENIFDAHPLVQMSCVIGVPDPLKIQKVKAFIMLKPGNEPSEENKALLMAYARKNIAKYALPYDIEFRPELPKTLVGKVAYRVLEEEELGRTDAQSTKDAGVKIRLTE